MIEHRNENASGHIVCIEDSIEFTHQHKNCLVTQRELGADTGTFDQALSDALQEAPDAVAIGAIRDARTIESAIGIAETGRLCIGTLLAGSGAQALESAFESNRGAALIDYIRWQAHGRCGDSICLRTD